MNWSAFLADENESGLKGWFNNNEQPLTDAALYSATTSGLNNNGASANGVLEGTINLAAQFGAFPPQIHVAAAPFVSADGGALVGQGQAPAGNGDGTIQAAEFLVLNTRDIALDLPTSDAGPEQSAEAGMTVILSGNGTVPSGLPFTFSWTQLSGPAVTINAANEAVASFTAAFNVAEPTALTFRLRVNDTRFDADDTTSVQLQPMIDSDGDGLSDQEELTGNDNVLTTPNPSGVMTNPTRSDTDGDGMNDGDEAIAGTDPNAATSRFRVVAIDKNTGNVTLVWSSIAGRSYQLQTRTAHSESWSDIGSSVKATSGTTSRTVASKGAKAFYRVRVLP
jgi:hypothetical protein